tara:strand:- start:3 stop:527 length:525 start_codon:yes stop_codon:yes gene_type:complete
MSICSIGQSQCENNVHYPVRVTLYPTLLNEYNVTGHIEAEILNLENLPESIQKNYNFKEDCYYINYRRTGNIKPPTNPTERYKGVICDIIYLNEEEIIQFITSANEDAQKISNNNFGDWKTGYNIIKNNCADAVIRAFNMVEIKDNPGITIPKHVFSNLPKQNQTCCELVINKH